MNDEELAHNWAEALKNGGLKELRRLAARHESLKEAKKKGGVDSELKSDKLDSD